MTIVAAVILIAGIAGIYIVMKNKNASEKKGTEPAGPPADLPVKDSDKDELEPILSSLLQLNILMRKDPEFPEETTLEIEGIIDDLMVIIPAMIAHYPAETLTYEIKKIGREHLFKTVKEYLDLSPESRDRQLNMFKQTIDSLNEISQRSRQIVEKNETAEFKTMANFLAGKFS